MNNKHGRRLICRTLWIAIDFLLVVGVVACERPMTVAVTKDSNPPSFKVSGSGRLFFFSVSEVSADKPSSDDSSAMWKIRPTQEDRISELPEIIYGVAPAGFSQSVPQDGPPRPLMEGKLYQAGGPGLEADGGWIRFTIKGGKAVVVSSGH